MDLGLRDLISSLPDALICHILSLLSTKEAASTSVLAKRWRFLFAFVKDLDFDDSVYLLQIQGDGKQKRGKTPASFMEFVDRVLALQGDDTINKFSLTCNDEDVDPVRVTSWILNVLGRGVSDLDLNLMVCPFTFKIFVSKTLVRLKLVQGDDDDFSFNIDVEDVFLPKLKTLHLDSVKFKEEDVGFAKLLYGCLGLEELVLINLEWHNWKSCSVSITTLKRLTFSYEVSNFQNPESVSFDTPNLEYLKYSDTIAEKYPKVSLDSVVEASLGLRLSRDQSEYAYFLEYCRFREADEEKEIVGSAKNFLMEICNVQILDLSASAVEVLRFSCERTPVFSNLRQLTIESGWKILPSLLKNCPNLETLVLKGGIPKFNTSCEYMFWRKPQESTVPWLFSSALKVIKVITSGYINDPVRLEKMRQTLEENMPRFERVTMVYHNPQESDILLNQ